MCMKGRFIIKGDIHGDIDQIIYFIERFNLGDGDNIIILGDFGLFWRKDQKDTEINIKFYEENCNGVHLYWLDGNHENFDIINSWNCNRYNIYNNSAHIHYCPRGFKTLIELQDGSFKKVLFMGGADSIDKYRRTEHLTWWRDEKITDKDIQGISGHYDYVFTHCCPLSVFKNNMVYLCTLSNLNQDNVVHDSEEKLEKLINNITYNKLFFGHYHVDKKLDDKHICLFEDFIELD